MAAGSTRNARLTDIYRASPLFTGLRDHGRLGGRCGACEFAAVCGGSRSRAFATTGDPYAEQPWCAYQPGTFPYRQDLAATGPLASGTPGREARPGKPGGQMTMRAAGPRPGPNLALRLPGGGGAHADGTRAARRGRVAWRPGGWRETANGVRRYSSPARPCTVTGKPGRTEFTS